MPRKNSNPVLALLLCAFLWSTGGLLIKLVSWNPFAIAGIRSLLGAITITLALKRLPVVFVRNTNGSINRRDTIDRILAGFFYSATMILFVVATKMTTAANAILLQYTNPLYIIILGPFLLHEKNDWIDYASVIGVMCGMVLFLADGLSGGNLLGNIIALSSGVTFGLSTIFMRRQKDGHPEDSFTLSHILTFIITLPFLFDGGNPGIKGSIGLLLLGVMQIGLPSILYARGITRVTAISAVLITMLEPLMNPLWVLLFYGEKPSVSTLTGGLLILLVIFVRVVLKNAKGKSK